jgi:beta-galactosidase
MEQQPGPVNWAPWNPAPKPGMVRLWSWEALAHGAETLSYFRWRQAPFAQEQLHAGLHRPDRSLSVGGAEATAVGRELGEIGVLPATEQAAVALVFDYQAAWVTEIQPHGRDFSMFELCLRWYEAARRWGVDVDVVPQDADLSGYAVVLVPCLPLVTAAGLRALSGTDARLVVGPRAGSRTEDFAIPKALPPGGLESLVGVRVTQVASLRPGLRHEVTGGLSGAMIRWREWVESRGEVLAAFADGSPAVTALGGNVYVAGWPDAALLEAVMAHALDGVEGRLAARLPRGVRMRRRGRLRFAFNYGPEPWAAPGGTMVLGTRLIAPQGVGCWSDG